MNPAGRPPRVFEYYIASGFAIAVRQQGVYLGESRLFDYANNKHFLRGFESGIADCGMYIGNRPMLGTLTNRLFELQTIEDFGEDAIQILPIEINSESSWSIYSQSLGTSRLFRRV